ncbi:MAG: signal peptidase I [Eubacteriales bacterium]|nr:signal peptidase I [Eubacteriales bacterium]
MAKKKKTEQSEQFRLSRDILALLACALAAVLVAVTVRMFGFGLVVVRSEAMGGTLRPGDIVLVSQTAQPEAGNVVLAGALNGSAFRRVLGMPGDRIGTRESGVVRNGMELYEPYASGEMAVQIPESRLGEGLYLLLPDDRSCEGALVQRGAIAGVARAVVWPPSRAGFL